MKSETTIKEMALVKTGDDTMTAQNAASLNVSQKTVVRDQQGVVEGSCYEMQAESCLHKRN